MIVCGIGAACCARVEHVGLGPMWWDVYSGPAFSTIEEPVAFLHGRAERAVSYQRFC
jgi:hypothetical protein